MAKQERKEANKGSKGPNWGGIIEKFNEPEAQEALAHFMQDLYAQFQVDPSCYAIVGRKRDGLSLLITVKSDNWQAPLYAGWSQPTEIIEELEDLSEALLPSPKS